MGKDREIALITVAERENLYFVFRMIGKKEKVYI